MNYCLIQEFYKYLIMRHDDSYLYIYMCIKLRRVGRDFFIVIDGIKYGSANISCDDYQPLSNSLIHFILVAIRGCLFLFHLRKFMIINLMKHSLNNISHIRKFSTLINDKTFSNLPLPSSTFSSIFSAIMSERNFFFDSFCSL